MKRGIQIVTLIAIIVGFYGCRKSSVDILYDKKYVDEIKAARKDASFYLSRNFIPGGNFAVLKDGKIIYSEGMGYASLDLEVPATRSTKFRIGEVSELFTNIIYQKMIEDGILNPDSAVQNYIPDYLQTDYPITLKQLAYHTSGIRTEDQTEEDWRGLNISLQQGIDKIKNEPLESEPNLFQNPSMFNYNLLGLVMEKASGKRYNNLLKEYITDTLHLSNTQVDNAFQIIKGRSDFFDYNLISQVVKATTRDLRYRAPSKGILSNAEDLVKFGNAVFFSDFLSKETKESIFKPVYLLDSIPTAIVNGWVFLYDKEGNSLYGRKGTVTGGGAALLVIPHEKLIVAGVVNLTSRLDDIPVFDIANHFSTKPEEEDPEPKDAN